MPLLSVFLICNPARYKCTFVCLPPELRMRVMDLIIHTTPGTAGPLKFVPEIIVVFICFPHCCSKRPKFFCLQLSFEFKTKLESVIKVAIPSQTESQVVRCYLTALTRVFSSSYLLQSFAIRWFLQDSLVSRCGKLNWVLCVLEKSVGFSSKNLRVVRKSNKEEGGICLNQ